MNENSKMFCTIFDQLCMQVCIIDNQGLLKYYNDPFKSYFKLESSKIGASFTEMLETNQYQIISSADIRLIIDGIINKQNDHWIDLVSMKKKVMYLDLSDSNMVALLFKPFRNCTVLNNALEDVEIKYSLLNRTTEHASAVMEPKTRKFTACNKQMLHLFGLDSEADLEDITVISVSPEYQPDGELSVVKAKKMMEKAIKEGFNDFMWTHLSKRNHEFTTRVHLSTFGPNKDIMFCVFTLPDDEKKKRENEARKTLEIIVEDKTRQLRQLVVELETTQELLVNVGKVEMTNKIVSGIAHELGTPLGTSITAISFLKQKLSSLEKLDNEERYIYTDANIASIISGLDIVEQSVTSATEKFEFIRETLLARKQNKRCFDLKNMVKRLINSLFSRELDIERNFDLKMIDNDSVSGDPLIFQSIFTHLIRNSIEHSNRDNQSLMITIGMVTNSGMTEITYRDNGIGFDESLLKSYLNPFVSSKRIKGKMGIGLTLVNNLVTDMNGVINVANNHNGFEIIIRIPDIMRGADYV